MPFLPNRSAEAVTLCTGDGTHQKLVTVPPWLPDDIWVTGVNPVIWSATSIVPPQLDYQMCGINTGAGAGSGAETPLFNFCVSGDRKTDFDFPPGYGIFFPGIGHITPQRNICLYGKVPVGQPQFFAFITMRYQLASEVTGYVEPKTKTLQAGQDHQVPFLILQEPWETVAINIIGVDSAVDQGAHVSQHICNSANPDILINGLEEKSMRRWLPQGVSVRLPAIGEILPKHIDMHVNLGVGTEPRPHHAWMIVYYLPVPP